MKGKNIIIFGAGAIGGFAGGSAFVISRILKSERLKAMVIDILSDKIKTELYGKTRPIKYSECTKAVKIIYNTQKDAMKVRDELKNVASAYGFASLADYYELANYYNQSNITSSFANTKYGWNATSLKYVTIDYMDGGYIISLPHAYKIED